MVSVAHNYDEEDDGFAFTRTRAKRAKAEAAIPPIIEEDKPETRAEAAPPKRSRKRSVGSPVASAEVEVKDARRRSARHSGEHEKEAPALQVKKRRKRVSNEAKPDQDSNSTDQPSSNATQPPGQEDQQNHAQPSEITFDATKIALPFADTPRIQRNKDMRKTNAARRSSLGLRGRRASSLIDTGRSTGMHHCVHILGSNS